MKSKWLRTIAAMLVPCFFLISCIKNETKFYADKETNGLSIFSNTGDNVFTCYINDSAWRTGNRYSAGFLSPARSEIFLSKQSDSVSNTLHIEWYGYYANGTNNFYSVDLYINVPATFSEKDINSLQGKRLTIDSTTGYFFINGLSNYTEKGTGIIYFNKANYDSTINDEVKGHLSGLLEATSPSYKITNGRFDHELTRTQVGF